jgi:NADPH-dependent curcumin reductase CurA
MLLYTRQVKNLLERGGKINVVRDVQVGSFQESLVQLEAWFKEGKLGNRETFEMGFENAGKAFVSMMTGKNNGKLIIQVDV